jgi:hypothetical protein
MPVVNQPAHSVSLADLLRVLVEKHGSDFVLGGREPGRFDLDARNLTKGVARQTGRAILNPRPRDAEQPRSRHAQQFDRF